MQRIVIFGDSFSVSYGDNQTWTTQLAGKFDAEHINYSVSGSSIEYSLYKLKDYIQNDYQSDDIIIFIATNPSRSPIIHPEYDPKWACFHNRINKNLSSNHIQSLNDNMDTNNVLLNMYYKAFTRYSDVNVDKYKYWLISSVLNTISNDAFFVCAFDSCEEHSNRENFIISKLKIKTVANLKLPTANHLTKINHDVLAKLIYESIINKNDLLHEKHFAENTEKDKPFLPEMFTNDAGIKLN